MQISSPALTARTVRTKSTTPIVSHTALLRQEWLNAEGNTHTPSYTPRPRVPRFATTFFPCSRNRSTHSREHGMQAKQFSPTIAFTRWMSSSSVHCAGSSTLPEEARLVSK